MIYSVPVPAGGHLHNCSGPLGRAKSHQSGSNENKANHNQITSQLNRVPNSTYTIKPTANPILTPWTESHPKVSARRTAHFPSMPMNPCAFGLIHLQYGQAWMTARAALKSQSAPQCARIAWKHCTQSIQTYSWIRERRDWPDSPEHTTKAAIRQKMWYLRTYRKTRTGIQCSLHDPFRTRPRNVEITSCTLRSKRKSHEMSRLPAVICEENRRKRKCAFCVYVSVRSL